MEASITEGFLKNIEEAGKRYTQQVEKLSQQYAAAIQAIRTVPAVDPDSIEQRLSHQFPKDIGDLNTRVLKIERDRRDDEYEDGLGAWITSPEFEFLSEGLQNEVVSVPEVPKEEAATLRNIVVQLDNDDIEMKTAKEETKEAPAKEETKEETKEEAKEEEAEEEEGEQLELEELEYEDKMYYKDGENNVYSANDDGEVNETPVGRWIEKRKVVKFY